MNARAFGAVVLAAALLAAAPAKPSRPAPAAMPAGFVVPDGVTTHVLRLDGKTLRYTARAGTIVLRDDDERPVATMFYTAFTLNGADRTRRPVTFFYNGGPGSSTVWLRMGSFGPMRVVTGANGTITGPPPYRLVENRYSLLDASDLVFVDMPASGYGRILPGADAKKIFGTDNDVRAFAQFVERYCTQFGRWNSPKVLYGESYGTPRTAMLVDRLQNDGVGMNGVVLQSSILNYALASREVYGANGTTDWPYIFILPTEAATAWYYRAVPGAPARLDDYMREVEAFAMGDYRRALAAGDNIPASTFERIAARMSRYTGLSETYVRTAKLRVSGDHFLAEFQRSHGKTEGAYDSRYQLFALDRAAEFPGTGSDERNDGRAVRLAGQRLHARRPALPNEPAVSDRRLRGDPEVGAVGFPPQRIARARRRSRSRQGDDVQPRAARVFGQRVLRFGHPVSRDRLRPATPRFAAGTASTHYVRLLSRRAHDLPQHEGVGFAPR